RLVLRQPVAAREHRRSGGGNRAAEQVAPVALPGAHQGEGLLHGWGSLFAWSSGTAYQPVIIDRISFQTPAMNTSATWTTTNSNRPKAARKGSVRADCRPPRSSTQPVKTASRRGDIASPAMTTS